MHTIGSLDTLGRDVHEALRALRRSLAFSIVALLTLAIGIGANTAIFSDTSQNFWENPAITSERTYRAATTFLMSSRWMSSLTTTRVAVMSSPGFKSASSPAFGTL